MTLTEILGAIGAFFGIMATMYGMARRMDIRDENAKEHAQFNARFDAGSHEFEAINIKLNNLLIEVNNVRNQYNETQRNYLLILESNKAVLGKMESLLIDNGKIKTKLGIE